MLVAAVQGWRGLMANVANNPDTNPTVRAGATGATPPERRLSLVADTLTGGLGAAAIDHARWFAERGWDVRVAAPGATTRTELVADRVATIDIPIPGAISDARGALRAAARLRPVLRMSAPAIVHCHGLRSFAITKLARPFHPAYVTFHDIGNLPGGELYTSIKASAMGAL